MRTKSLFLILLLFLVTISGFGQSHIYVSTEGKDTWKGSLNKPFQSLERAKQEVQELKKKSEEDILVHIRDGRYELRETLVFSPDDGGSEKQRVIYRGYEDEMPLISGGIRLKNWRRSSDGLWECRVPEGLIFRQLYVDTQKAVRARTPNEGDYYRVLNYDYPERAAHLDNDHVAPWNNMEEVEMVAQAGWTVSYLRLSEIIRNDDELRFHPGSYSKVFFREPESELFFNQPHPTKHAHGVFHFENAKEFIDAHGEWYLDQETSTLYYKAHVWEDMNEKEVIAPLVETLLSIQGSLDEPVKNLVFSNLKFGYSTWTRPSEQGYVDGQGGQYILKTDLDNNQYSTRPPSAVYAHGAEGIRIEGCVFRNLGATAVDYHLGVSHSEIVGNVFQGIAGTAIALGQFSAPEVEYHTPYNPEDEREICSSDRIAHNIIKDAAQVYYGCVGIGAGYPRDVLIEHNDLSFLPAAGISMGWGWTDQENAMRSNKVYYNHIHHVANLMDDGGAIYTLSKQPDSHIMGNHVHDMVLSPWASRPIIRGIYLDQGSDGFTVENNVLDDFGYEKFRGHMNGTIILKNEGHWSEEVRQKAGPQGDYKKMWIYVD